MVDSPLAVALITLICLVAGGLLGGALRRWLPVDGHLTKDARDFVRLGAGLIGTMAALAMGLLVSSAKSSFDTINDGLINGTSSRIDLDRLLAQYGPETKAARDQLKHAFILRIENFWPKDGDLEAGMEAEELSTEWEELAKQIRILTPVNDEQAYLKATALSIFGDGMKLRWSVEYAHSPPPRILLIVLILWFTVLFTMLGLLAQRNATLNVVVIACALAVAGGIFLILDMSGPFDGLFKVPRTPMENALRHFGRE